MKFKYKRIGGKYRYQLTQDYLHELDFVVTGYPSIKWATLIPNRVLIVKEDYCFNCVPLCSDFPALVRANCIRNALCQLISKGKLPVSFRLDADREFRKAALEDGLDPLLANVIYSCLRLYAAVKYLGH